MEGKVGFIGGSGLYRLEGVEKVKEHLLETPFGRPSSAIVECQLEGHTFYFLSRHDKGHVLSPSEINYQANVFALKEIGVKTLVSLSAVGSLEEGLPPGTMALPVQFIDWTKGLRKRSFFEDGIVGHVSCAYPVEKALSKRIQKACDELAIPCKQAKAYICIEGPQFSSRAESEIYRSFGASVIGMTNLPEAYLAKEAGMAYATVAMVTDYDCWKDEHCSVEEILKVMGGNTKNAQKLIASLAVSLNQDPVEFVVENQFVVITNPEQITKEKQAIVDTLLR